MPDNYAYSKRPLWQWIFLYLVLGAVVYGLIYYFIFAKKGNYMYQPATTTQSVSPSQAVANPSSNIYTTRNDATKGAYLADFAGMTLYIFGKDTSGLSNCNSSCSKVWPPYTSGATAQKTLPANISVIVRTDGTKQFAWKGMPLYYYASDQKPGDIMGDGIAGIWHIAKP